MRAHPAGPRHAELVSDSLPAAPPADLNALAQHVWPIGLKRAVSGELMLNGRDVPSLVRDSGTPVFLLDDSDFRSRARAYATAFTGADVFYASKAFSSVALLSWVADEGLGLDVATGGRAGRSPSAPTSPMEQVLFHGNNKSVDELNRAVQRRVSDASSSTRPRRSDVARCC